MNEESYKRMKTEKRIEKNKIASEVSLGVMQQYFYARGSPRYVSLAPPGALWEGLSILGGGAGGGGATCIGTACHWLKGGVARLYVIFFWFF